MTKKNLFFLSAIIFISLLTSFLLYPEYLSDDAFIHIAFIKSFINGDGLSFAGSRTYGTTSPLWIFLGSILTLLSGSPELSIRILSGFFTILSIILFQIILDITGLNVKIKTAGLISIAINPFILRWSLTGMESTAAMFLMTYFIYLFRKDNWFKHQILTGILVGFSFLVRPEFTGFFLITFIFFLIKHKADPKKLIFALPAIIILFAWIFFTYLYYGVILPNTYTAKSSSQLFFFDVRTFYRNLQTLFAVNLPEFLITVILLFIFISLIKMADRRNIIPRLTNNIKSSGIQLIFFWLVAFYIFYTLRDVTIISRYAIIFIPFIILFVLIIFNAVSQSFSKKIRVGLLSVYFVIIIVSSFLLTLKVIKPSADDFVNGFQTTYKDIASIINSYSKYKNVSVGAADVGIIGAYSNARIFDSVGLVDNERFKYKSTLEYYLDKKPDFIILREEEKIEDVIPSGTNSEILFSKKLPGFGIKDPEERIVTLYKINWN